MFTIVQIQALHAQVKSGADFPKYVQALKTLGVVAYDNFVSDGHTTYYGADDYQTTSNAKYPAKEIAEAGATENLRQCLAIHQQGQIDYLTFCQQAAEAGVAKWTVHLSQMTCSYYDQAGNLLVVEAIPYSCLSASYIRKKLTFFGDEFQVILSLLFNKISADKPYE